MLACICVSIDNNVFGERFARTVIDVWKEFIRDPGGMGGLNFYNFTSFVGRCVQFYSIVIN